MRENSETLELYKKLLVQKIILPGIDGDGKNSLKQIEKKISILQENEKKNIKPNSKNLVFLGQEFDIKKKRRFDKFSQKNFDIVILEKDNSALNEILTDGKFEKNIF